MPSKWAAIHHHNRHLRSHSSAIGPLSPLLGLTASKWGSTYFASPKLPMYDSGIKLYGHRFAMCQTHTIHAEGISLRIACATDVSHVTALPPPGNRETSVTRVT